MFIQFYITIQQDWNNKLWSARIGELADSDPKMFAEIKDYSDLDQLVKRIAEEFGEKAHEYIYRRFK